MSDETRGLIAAGLALLVREATTPPEPFGYGRDLVCVDDLTHTLRETDPKTTESLAQDIYHRITTERGSLVDDPDYGEDVRGFLSAGLTPNDLVSISGRLTLEIQKDDRVGSVTVELEPVLGSPVELNITIAVTPEDPALVPFVMVLAATSADVVLKAIS